MSRFSEYFKKKIVRPDKDGGCPPGTILTDEGCLPTGRRKSPRGFQDPEFPAYCGLEKEIPCLPERDFTEPEPAPLPLPDPPPGKGEPQGNDAFTLTCPSAVLTGADGTTLVGMDGQPLVGATHTVGSVTIPENFFVRIPEYSNDPAINDANAVAAKADADAEASSFAESTLRCIHYSSAVEASCPGGTDGDAQSLPSGYLRQQVPYTDLLNPSDPEEPATPDTGIISSLTDTAQGIVDDNLRCYRVSAADTLTCAEEFGSLEFTDTPGGTVIGRMEDRLVVIPAGRIRELVDLDEESAGYLEPSQAQVDASRDATYPGQLQCRLLSAEVSVSCPSAANPGSDTTPVSALTPSQYVVVEGRSTALVSNDTPPSGSSLNDVAQESAESIYSTAQGMAESEFTCFYGNPGAAQGCADPTPDSVTGQLEAYLHPTSSDAFLPAAVIIKAAAASSDPVYSKFSQEAADAAVASAYSEAQINLVPVCVYGNLEKTDPCPDPLDTHDESVNGKALKGEILQEGDWDDELSNSIRIAAEALAGARRRCLYGNDEKSGDCDALKGGVEVEVTNDTANFEGNITTIPADTVFSTTRKITANATAEAVANGSTVCLYSNDGPVTSSCPASGEPEYTGPYFADIEGVVEAGEVVSAVSFDDADDQAAARADAKRTCVGYDQVGGEFATITAATSASSGGDCASTTWDVTMNSDVCGPVDTHTNPGAVLNISNGEADAQDASGNWVSSAMTGSAIVDYNFTGALSVYALITYTKEGRWLVPSVPAQMPLYTNTSTSPGSDQRYILYGTVTFEEEISDNGLDPTDNNYKAQKCYKPIVNFPCPFRIPRIPLDNKYQGYAHINDGGELVVEPVTVLDVLTGVTHTADNAFSAAAFSGQSVYLKHDVGMDGETNTVALTAEDGTTIPFVEGVSAGTYYYPICSVSGSSGSYTIEIFRSNSIDWHPFIVQGSSGVIGSSSSVGSSSGGPGPSGSGSSKDTAIVPAPWLGEDKFTALFVEEQPEVVFSDHFDAPIRQRVSRFKLDKRFFDVCSPMTIKVVGLAPDRPGSVGVEIIEETAEIVIRVGWFSNIKRVTGRISGVRKGFDGLRLPPKTREDFEANERWIRRD